MPISNTPIFFITLTLEIGSLTIKRLRKCRYNYIDQPRRSAYSLSDLKNGLYKKNILAFVQWR